MLDFNTLPESTARLLDKLKDLEEVQGFFLIGGTALALQVSHRVSEDIDLAWLHGNLPQPKIDAIVTKLAGETKPARVTDQAALLNAENDGIDLHQTQQDWQIAKVKLTFFAPYEPAQLAVYERARPTDLGYLSIVDPDTVFELKSSLLFERKASRDLYDLWYFLEHGGKTVDDLLSAMDRRKEHRTSDSLLDLLAPASLHMTDPGFKPLLADAPADTDALLQRMKAIAEEHRSEMARRLGAAHFLSGRGEGR